MDSIAKLNRRAFLQAAAAAAAAAGATVGCSHNPSPWRFFSIDEARALAAMADQIIPPDQDPGASWAGVVNYIDRQLCGPYQNLQSTYRVGLTGVDQSSRALHGKLFADLDSANQLELLHLLEDNKTPGAIWKQIKSSEFFGTVVDHTMQGFYGDPRHGGNRDGVSWKMLNLPYPPIRGRLRPDEGKPRTT
ncbi:MAG TPA: gluconate 2-dehydrogenase subunit 3 family protein [Candidatus Sulfotelmatobacter sp.]|nr:gluconate 2-dehydrogenase subunit 3 family protein [Candidatus Sulfotelmatobacter sp.]